MIPGTYTPKENKSNDYMLDRSVQRHFSYTGIRSLAAQDMAVQSDQSGVIADRTQENLVSADRAVIMVRQKLLKAARDLQAGKEPPEQSARRASARAPWTSSYRSMPIGVVKCMRLWRPKIRG